MMVDFIEKLKRTNIHTPRLALVRLLLALGMLLTIVFNNINIIADQGYTYLPDKALRHDMYHVAPFKKADLFMDMSAATARLVVIVILLVVMSGFLPQVTGLLHFWACFSVHSYYNILNGGDDLALVLSFLLLPICLTDTRINQWRRKETPPSGRNIVANIALFAIRVQAAWLYLDAGVAKMFVKEWKEGTAVYYYTSHYRLGAPAWLQRINEFITLTPAVKMLTWGTLLFEVIMACCLFFPLKWRKKFFIPALFFHFLIVINFGLLNFFISMCALLILYLLGDNKKGLEASPV